MTLREREELLVAQHGEVCVYAQAARMLNRDVKTIKAMLEDGRLDYACGETRVDVRSIARYIMSPKAEDFKAKQRRTGHNYMV